MQRTISGEKYTFNLPYNFCILLKFSWQAECLVTCNGAFCNPIIGTAKHL